MIFGRWTVLGPGTPSPGGAAMLNCICACGKFKSVNASSLRRGLSKSCGCLSAELAGKRATRHGATRGGSWSPEYRSYRKMRERCLNPLHKHYGNYGGRGIAICAAWLDSFSAFLAEMGPKPTPAYTLERNDNERGYEPNNCRWATRREQNQNARKVRAVVRSDGVRYPSLREAAKAVGGTDKTIKSACLDGRTYLAHGWSFVDRQELNDAATNSDT